MLNTSLLALAILLTACVRVILLNAVDAYGLSKGLPLRRPRTSFDLTFTILRSADFWRWIWGVMRCRHVFSKPDKNNFYKCKKCNLWHLKK